MTGPEVFEDRRVGAHIKAHREHIGVSLREIIAAAGAGSDRTIRFVERAERPSIELIEGHHDALMAAYALAEDLSSVPLARREQWYATVDDEVLWQVAMQSSPSVVWWWAARNEQGRRGAWCNICSALVHGYDTGRGLTRPARVKVMAHRLTHINTLIAPVAGAGKEVRT